MLKIARTSRSARRVVYALAGEITADQLPRLEQIVIDDLERGRELTFDLSQVWRVDRDASSLLAFFTSSPGNLVHLEGTPVGLLEWLRSAPSEDA